MALAQRLWASPTLLIALCALFWSANSVVGRAVHGAIGPAALSFGRWFGAALLMGLIARRRIGLHRGELRRHLPLLFAAGVVGVGLFGLLLYIGLGYTTAVNSLLMQTALPAVTMLILLLVFRERPSGLALSGSGIALLGVIAIVCRGSPAALLALRLNPGDALTLFATLLYAGYSIVVARGPKLDPLVFASITFASAAIAMLPAWGIELAVTTEPPFGPRAVAAILFVAVVPSCLAYLCYNRAVTLAGPATAGNVTLLMPLFGSLMAVLFLGERLALYHLAGAALIVAGILVGRRAPAVTSPRTPAR